MVTEVSPGTPISIHVTAKVTTELQKSWIIISTISIHVTAKVTTELQKIVDYNIDDFNSRHREGDDTNTK